MVYPPLPVISHDLADKTITRNLTSRIRSFKEDASDSRGFNVFFTALPDHDFKPVILTKDIHKDYPTPKHAIKIFFVSKSKIKVNCKTASTANEIANNNN